MLGAEMMGIYQVAFSVFIVFLVMVSSGIPITVTALTARSQFDLSINQGSTISAAVFINIIVGLIAISIVLFFENIWRIIFTSPLSYNILIMLMPAIIFSSIGDSFKGNVWGKKHYFAVSCIELIEQTVRILICMLLFLFAQNALVRANLAALSLSLACAISSIIMIFYYRRLGGKSLDSPQGHLKRVFQLSTPITIMRVSSALVNFLIAILIPKRLIVSGLTNSQAMEMYGSSVGMSMGFLFAPITLTGALAVALVPKINEDYECKNMACLGNTAKKALNFSIITAFLFIPLFLCLGNEIGFFIFKNHLSGEFLAKASIIIVSLTIEHITSSMMNSMGLQLKAFINYYIGTALLVVCIWFLTPWLRMDALIIGLGISNTVSAILHIYQIKKLTSMKLNFLKTLGLNLAFLIPSCALTYSTKALLSSTTQFVRLIICGAVAVGSIFILNICFNLLDLSAFFAIKRKSKKDKTLAIKSNN